MEVRKIVRDFKTASTIEKYTPSGTQVILLKRFTFNSRKKKFEKNDKYNINICNFEKSYKA